MSLYQEKTDTLLANQKTVEISAGDKEGIPSALMFKELVFSDTSGGQFRFQFFVVEASM